MIEQTSQLLAQKACIPGNIPGATICFTGPITPAHFGATGDNITMGDLINKSLLFLFPIAGLILFANILYAGFLFITSGGDPKKMDAAKGRLTASLLGFFALFIAFWVTQIIAFIFGINGIF